MPFAQGGLQTGVKFAEQGADTGFRFFTDPNFNFQKEGEAYQQSGAQTQSMFGGLAGLAPQAAPADAPISAAAAAPEKGGWQSFMKEGVSTGGNFASQGGNTAFRFATDPNFDFQKEGAAYQDSGAATKAGFAAISAPAPEKSDEVADGAAAPTGKAGGWMPFAQGGLQTGVKFAEQGADTGFRFFTDPNFNFQKEGEAYQQSGAQTQSMFGGLAGLAPQAAPADAPISAAAAAPEKGGWQSFMKEGVSTGGNFASQGGNTAFRFATDPNFDFQKEGAAYQDSGAATKAGFAAISAPAPEKAATSTSSTPTSSSDSTATQPQGPSVATTQSVHTWQEFMNTGINTGINYAMAGAETAGDFSAGKADGAATGQKFGELSQQTGSNFAVLSGGSPAMAASTPSTTTLSPAPQASKAVATVTPAAVNSASAPTQPTTQPTVHNWEEFMHTGIQAGLAYAKAGAETAEAFSEGKADGTATAQKFGSLSQATGNDFATLSGLPSALAASASSAAQAPSPIEAIRVEPAATHSPPHREALGSIPLFLLMIAGIAALITRRIKTRSDNQSRGHYSPQNDEDELV